MKLTGPTIHYEVERGGIVIDPYEPKHVGPNSYDLRLSKYFYEYDQVQWEDTVGGSGSSDVLDMKAEPKGRHYEIPEDGIVLEPGRLYLGSTMERAGSTKYVPCIEGRSSIARLGLQVHLTAGFGDLGFQNVWTLEMVATKRIHVYPGVRICQIYFDVPARQDVEREGKKTKLYTGKYVDNDPRPQPSRLWKEFLP